MSRPFLTPINMNNLEILNLRLQQTQPAGTAVGLTYYDATTTNRPQVYSAGTWNTVPFIGAGTPGTIGVADAAAAGSSLSAARLDHTHASPALATTSVSGFMSAADKTKLDAATSVATASTLVMRDASSRFRAADPSDTADVATKGYVDNVAAGMSWKPAVKRATVAVIDLSAGTRAAQVLTTGTAALTVDGTAVTNGQRILVKDGTSGLAGAGNADNGIFVVSGVGSDVTLTRATDMDTFPETPAAAVFVELGSTLADTAWVSTTDAGGVLGTDPITFAQFAGASTYTFTTDTGSVGTSLKSADSTANAFVIKGIVAGSSKITLAGSTVNDVAVDIDEANLTLNNIGGTLGIAKGGTNSGTALSGSSIMISNGTSIVQGAAGTATTVLHGNASGAPTYGAVSLTADVSGTLPVGNGGTGATNLTSYAVILGNGGSAVAFASPGTAGLPLISNGAAANPSFQAFDLSDANTTGALSAIRGGTGQNSYVIGDILYASTTTSLSRLAGVATGNAIISGGVGTAPSWGKIGLTTHVSGTLPVTNGGTGLATITNNGVLYGAGTSVVSVTAASAAAGAVLRTVASGGAPSFGAIDLAAVGAVGSSILAIANGGTNSSTALSGSTIMISNGTQVVQGAAGTSTTVLHGNASGAPTYGAVSLTADVSGTLPAANGGTSFSTYAAGDLIYASAANTLSKLAATTNGYVLTLAAGLPVWAAPAASILRYQDDIGDNSATSIAVTHSLGTRDVLVSVRNATTFEEVECDVTYTSTSVVTLVFAVAPTTDQYRVVIVG